MGVIVHASDPGVGAGQRCSHRCNQDVSSGIASHVSTATPTRLPRIVDRRTCAVGEQGQPHDGVRQRDRDDRHEHDDGRLPLLDLTATGGGEPAGEPTDDVQRPRPFRERLHPLEGLTPLVGAQPPVEVLARVEGDHHDGVVLDAGHRLEEVAAQVPGEPGHRPLDLVVQLPVLGSRIRSNTDGADRGDAVVDGGEGEDLLAGLPLDELIACLHQCRPCR